MRVREFASGQVGKFASLRVASGDFSLQFSAFSLFLFTFFLLFLSACGANAPVGTDADIAVAEQFAAFYAVNGGERFFPHGPSLYWPRNDQDICFAPYRRLYRCPTAHRIRPGR